MKGYLSLIDGALVYKKVWGNTGVVWNSCSTMFIFVQNDTGG